MSVVLMDAREPDRRLLNASSGDDEAGIDGGGILDFKLLLAGVMALEVGAELPVEECV